MSVAMSQLSLHLKRLHPIRALAPWLAAPLFKDLFISIRKADTERPVDRRSLVSDVPIKKLNFFN